MNQDMDDYLSPQDQRLWSLTYYCLFKYAVPVIYKQCPMFAPKGIDEEINFYVQSNLPNSKECYEFLLKETESMKREKTEPINGNEFGFPGTNASVYYFSGVKPYVTSDIVKSVSEKLVESFMSNVRAGTAAHKRSQFKVVKDE